MLNFRLAPVILAAMLGFPWASKSEELPQYLIIHPQSNDKQRMVMPTNGIAIQNQTMLKNGLSPIYRIPVPVGQAPQTLINLLSNQPGVIKVELDSVMQTQEISNDPAYTNGTLWGMYSSDTTPVGPTGTTNIYGSQAEQAWASGKVGTTKVVVGVIDTGIDYRHPDLYLNIWLNPGEIRTLSFYSSLVDIDGDGLITFRDLNSSSNSSRVSDINANGYIDAGDLLADSRWVDGIDNDNNGYIDDLVGWNWVSNTNDPLDDNRHGTHVSGTIGGLGNNGIGVVGVNWNVLLVPLKFLNSGGSGYSSAGAQAVDYFTALTLANDKAYNPASTSIYLGTSNSWGGGGYLSALETAIINGAKANNYFIAAAGNSAVNIVSSPFYPAVYSTESAAGWQAVLAVASLNSTGGLSGFSNYGVPIVKIAAPGEGIYSSTPSNTYQTLSGTSMATPHVAGSLALMAASYPSADRRTLSNVLLTSATATPSLSGKVSTGGRLDVKDALVALGNANPPVDPPRIIWGTKGNDSLVGGSGSDSISGVPPTGNSLASLGKSQRDTLTGGGGVDTFVLGQVRGSFPYVFYSDADPKTAGVADYAILTDLNPDVDKIRLVRGSYRTRASGNDTYLYWNTKVAELIAIIKNRTLSQMIFTQANAPTWVIFE